MELGRTMKVKSDTKKKDGLGGVLVRDGWGWKVRRDDGSEEMVETMSVTGESAADREAMRWRFPWVGKVTKGDRWLSRILLAGIVVFFGALIFMVMRQETKKVEGVGFPESYRLVTVKTGEDAGLLHSVGGSEVVEFEWEKPRVMVYSGCIGLYGPGDQYLKSTEVIDGRKCKLLETEWVAEDGGGWSFEVVEVGDADEVVQTGDEKMLGLKDALARAIVDVEQDFVRGAYVYDMGEGGLYVWVARALVVGEETFEWRDSRVYQWDERFGSLNYIGSMKDRVLLYIENWAN